MGSGTLLVYVRSSRTMQDRPSTEPVGVTANVFRQDRGLASLCSPIGVPITSRPSAYYCSNWPWLAMS